MSLNEKVPASLSINYQSTESTLCKVAPKVPGENEPSITFLLVRVMALSFLAVQTASQVKRGIPYLRGEAESPRLSLSFASKDVSVNNTFCFLLLLLKKAGGTMLCHLMKLTS